MICGVCAGIGRILMHFGVLVSFPCLERVFRCWGGLDGLVVFGGLGDKFGWIWVFSELGFWMV